MSSSGKITMWVCAPGPPRLWASGSTSTVHQMTVAPLVMIPASVKPAPRVPRGSPGTTASANPRKGKVR